MCLFKQAPTFSETISMLNQRSVPIATILHFFPGRNASECVCL